MPVPEAEALVGAWRSVHDPSARAGVPAHVTLVVPWIPPEQIKQEHLEELEELLAVQGPFEFALEKVCWFGQRVLWLARTRPHPSSGSQPSWRTTSTRRPGKAPSLKSCRISLLGWLRARPRTSCQRRPKTLPLSSRCPAGPQKST